VEWRSFQLDPTYPRDARQPVLEAIQSKMGASPAQVRAMTGNVGALAEAEGLTYDFDNAVMVNTFDAHRVTHLAKAAGLGTEMHERLLRAQLVEAEVLNDSETLVRLATEVGLPEPDTRRVLASDEYATAVTEDIQEARALGVNGVPFFVIDRRYGISGAQPVEAFRSALATAATAGATH
jgi:predicted DsbA family dithiol-disulfide isomerase